MVSGSVTVSPLISVGLPVVAVLGVVGLVLWVVRAIIQREALKAATARASELVILQIMVPKETESQEETERRKNFKEVMSVAEQFFASLAAIAPHDPTRFLRTPPTLSFEIIAKGAIRFFVAVPRAYREILEKQILAYYPNAAVEETKEFRIFDAPDSPATPAAQSPAETSDTPAPSPAPVAPTLVGAAAELRLLRRFVLPVKTYQELESDPLNSITNTLSKLGESSRGAVQILIRPTSGGWQRTVFAAARAVQEGKPATMFQTSWYGRLAMALGFGLGESLRNSQNKQGMPNQVKLTPMQEELLKDLNEKSSKVGYETQIRLVVLSPTLQEAETNLNSLSSSFAQFQSPRSNGFRVRRSGSFLTTARDFLLRSFTAPRDQILNTAELASLYHLPNRFTETPSIEWLLARTLAPPVNLPEEGIVLGESVYRGERKLVRLKPNDRRRHMYMIGKTGVGKTTLLQYMFEQDVKNGNGCAYLDPNGDAIEYILSIIPPERADDVIVFDPSDTEWPMGLNVLEWKRPEDRDFLVAEWLEIFYKLFDPNRTGMVGPQFEHWGRNASLTVMSMPGGGTLIDIPRLFTDDAFRAKALGYVTDPVVRAFWEQQMAKTSDFHKSEMYNYFNSKFGRFMTNDLVRNIIGQTESAFDFREIMDSGKIFLVNLSKGKIGETNSYLLGMILVSKLQVAAFQRADIPEEERKDFFLYVDEFQNFTTSTFKTILSEARKYRLNLNITNQYIAQLPEDIRDAVIGNAGSLLAYRIGAADAEFLEKEFPGVTKMDLTNLTFTNTYVKMLIDGTPTKPFSMRGMKSPTPPNPQLADAIRQLSRLKYAKPSARVEALLAERLATVPVTSDSQPPTEAMRMS